MPIKKETSARLVKEKVPYEIISRDVVQSLTNPTALALYTYLLTLPEHWIVRRTQLLEHFDGLGRDRYDAGMRQLKGLGVVWIAETRNELGHVVDRTIVVETVPKVGKPTIGENPQVGKATIGENPPLRDTDYNLEIPIDIRDTPSDGFETFWNAYPKKADKVAAKKSWDKLKPSQALLTLLIKDVQNRVNQGEWQISKKHFIPSAGPYLNGRKWENEIIPRGDNGQTGSNTQQNQAKLTPAQRTKAARERLRKQREEPDMGGVVSVQ
jgi:hypothetical protein